MRLMILKMMLPLRYCQMQCNHFFCHYDFLNKYSEWPCKQLIKFDTRYRGDQSSLLDLLLVSDEKCISRVESGAPLGASDHSVITAVAQVRLQEKDTKKVIKRKFHKADYERISEYLTVRFDEMQDDITYLSFYNVLKDAIENNIPESLCRVNKTKPWINKTLFNEIDKKRRLWDKYKNQKNEENYAIFRRHNNNLKSQIRQARTKYEGLLDRGNN